MYQYFILLFAAEWQYVILICQVLCTIRQLMDIWVFLFLAIMSTAAMHIHVHIYVWMYVYLLDLYLGVELLGQIITTL